MSYRTEALRSRLLFGYVVWIAIVLEVGASILTDSPELYGIFPQQLDSTAMSYSLFESKEINNYGNYSHLFESYSQRVESYVFFKGLDVTSEYSTSLAISDRFLVVGAHGYDLFRGIVHVYQPLSASQIILQSNIVSPCGPNSNFGNAVDIDGENIIIAANRYNVYTGRVFIYSLYVGKYWIKRGILYSPLPQGAGFGRSVALSGSTAVVGTFINDAFIYENIENVWVLTASLSVNDTNASFGQSVDLQGDYLVVGAPDYQNGKGAAFVYNKVNGVWKLTTILQSETDSVYRFGSSVSIHGNSIAVGAEGYKLNYSYCPMCHDLEDDTGWVLVYDLDLDFNTWSLVWGTQSPLGVHSNFGSDVDLDESRLIVGAMGFPYGTYTGAAVLYKRHSQNNFTVAEFYPSAAGSSGFFGSCVRLGSAFPVIVGAFGHDILRGAMFLPLFKATNISSQPPDNGGTQNLINNGEGGLMKTFSLSIIILLAIVAFIASVIGSFIAYHLNYAYCCPCCCAPSALALKKKKKEEENSPYTVHSYVGYSEADDGHSVSSRPSIPYPLPMPLPVQMLPFEKSEFLEDDASKKKMVMYGLHGRTDNATDDTSIITSADESFIERLFPRKVYSFSGYHESQAKSEGFDADKLTNEIIKANEVVETGSGKSKGGVRTEGRINADFNNEANYILATSPCSPFNIAHELNLINPHSHNQVYQMAEAGNSMTAHNQYTASAYVQSIHCHNHDAANPNSITDNIPMDSYVGNQLKPRNLSSIFPTMDVQSIKSHISTFGITHGLDHLHRDQPPEQFYQMAEAPNSLRDHKSSASPYIRSISLNDNHVSNESLSTDTSSYVHEGQNHSLFRMTMGQCAASRQVRGSVASSRSAANAKYQEVDHSESSTLQREHMSRLSLVDAAKQQLDNIRALQSERPMKQAGSDIIVGRNDRVIASAPQQVVSILVNDSAQSTAIDVPVISAIENSSITKARSLNTAYCAAKKTTATDKESSLSGRSAVDRQRRSPWKSDSLAEVDHFVEGAVPEASSPLPYSAAMETVLSYPSIYEAADVSEVVNQWRVPGQYPNQSPAGRVLTVMQPSSIEEEVPAVYRSTVEAANNALQENSDHAAVNLEMTRLRLEKEESQARLEARSREAMMELRALQELHRIKEETRLRAEEKARAKYAMYKARVEESGRIKAEQLVVCYTPDSAAAAELAVAQSLERQVVVEQNNSKASSSPLSRLLRTIATKRAVQNSVNTTYQNVTLTSVEQHSHWEQVESSTTSTSVVVEDVNRDTESQFDEFYLPQP